MLKFYKRSLALWVVLLTILFTSCMRAQPVDKEMTAEKQSQDDDSMVSEEPTPLDESSVVKISDWDPILIYSMDDFYTDYRTLGIQVKGDKKVYEAANPLEYCFADMLSKVETIDMEAEEGKNYAKSYDYEAWDYRLKFSGARDILFCLDKNTFHYEGDQQLYILWGDSKPLWESLAFDSQNASAAVITDRVTVMELPYQEDLNGDGRLEQVSLSWERGRTEDLRGDLILRVENRQETIMLNEEWCTKPYHTMGVLPKVNFLTDKGSQEKAIVVTYAWATNGVGSTSEVYPFRWKDGNLITLIIKKTEINFAYADGKGFTANFPSFNKTIRLPIDKDVFLPELGEGGSLEQLGNPDVFSSHSLHSNFDDYNGDGLNELVDQSVIRLSSNPHIYLGEMTTWYQYDKGEIKPIDADMVSFYEE